MLNMEYSCDFYVIQKEKPIFMYFFFMYFTSTTISGRFDTNVQNVVSDDDDDDETCCLYVQFSCMMQLLIM